MKLESQKSVVLNRPASAVETGSQRLLVVCDDQSTSPTVSARWELFGQICSSQGWACHFKDLSDDSALNWLGWLWSRLPAFTSVHLQLTGSSLYSTRSVLMLLAARFFGRPISVGISGPAADIDGDHLRRNSFILRLIDSLAVESPYLHERLRRHQVNCTLLPTPLDDQWYLDRVTGSVQPVILWESECNGQDNLLLVTRTYQNVKQKYPRAELIVACPQSEFDRLQARVVGMSGVRLAHSDDMQELLTCYRKADVFLNTSVVDSMPLAVLRALASGLPVVTSAVGAVKQILTDGESGMLIPLDSHFKYANSIIDLTESDELAGRLSTHGRVVAEEYRLHKAMQRWRQCLMPQEPKNR